MHDLTTSLTLQKVRACCSLSFNLRFVGIDSGGTGSCNCCWNANPWRTVASNDLSQCASFGTRYLCRNASSKRGREGLESTWDFFLFFPESRRDLVFSRLLVRAAVD